MPAFITTMVCATAIACSDGGGANSCRQFEEGLYLRASLSDKRGVTDYIDSLRACGNDSPDVLMALGRFLCSKGDHAAAEEALARLTDDTGLNEKLRAEAFYYRATCAKAMSRYAEAIAWFNEAIEKGFDPVWCNNSLAAVYLDSDRPREALIAAQRSLEHAPRYAPALSNKGRAHELLGEPREAIYNYRMAMAAAGDVEPRYRSRTTQAWIAMNEMDSARASAEAGLQAFPNNRQIIYDRAEVANADGDYTLGRVLARRLILLGPRTAQDHIDVAYVYYDAGRMDSAFYYYSLGLRIEPMNAQANHNIGIICKRLGMFKEAQAYYDKALQVTPSSKYLLNSLVQLNLWQHNYEEAYRWVLVYNQHHYGDEYSLMGTGYVLMQLKRWEEAIPWLEAWLAKAPKDDRCVNNLARSHGKLGHAQQALDLFDQALALNPKNGYIYHNRASLLTDLGRYSNACADLQLAIDLDYTWVIDSAVLAMRAQHCPDIAVDRRILISEYRGNAVELADQSFIELIDPLRIAAAETIQLPTTIGEDLVFDPEASNAQSAFRVMPNPSTGPVTVERLGWGKEELAVRVFDSGARLLDHLRFGSDRLELDLSEHGAGTYVVMVVSDSAVLSTQRVVISD
ncbi:MAG TPA: tetratricopeptide repeat protein [Flavobacteriales bacterium]|nr:tetratricopeptide repeat protein [Flavobacteriales bacterium]